MSGFFDLMAANAVSVRAPISGQTGVWVYNSKTLVSSAMKMSGVVVSGRNNSMTVLSKGKSYDTIVRASASMKVNAGGVANSTIVSAGGYLYVSSGGVVDVVSAGNASITILSGGTATNIAAANGGHLNITVAPDTYIQGTRAGSAFEMKNAMISGYTISNGGMHVSSGGTANETTVAYQCYLRVSNGGVANSTIVSSSGDMNVYSGGTALETEWRPGCGTLDVDIEGVATVKLSGVYFCGESRATIDNTSSAMYLSGFSDSHVWVFSGGTASDCAVESVCFGGYAENCSTPIRENNGRNTYVYSGGVVNSFYANYYLANLYIRGAASNVSSFRGPTSVFVFSGGSLDGVIVGNGNYLYVSSGGTAVGILESGGIVVLKEGGAATFVPCIISGGTLGFRDALLGATIHSKTIATSCAVIGSALHIYPGGLVKDLKDTFSSTSIGVEGALLNYSGIVTAYAGISYIYISSGGLVSAAVLKCTGDRTSTGRFTVSSGGTALDIIVDAGATIVSNGGYLSSAIIDSGRIISVCSGGTALGVSLLNGATAVVDDGGYIEYANQEV